METEHDLSFLQRAKKIFLQNLKCLNFCKKRSIKNLEENLHFENLSAKEQTLEKERSILSAQQIDLNNKDEIENWHKFLGNSENFGLLKRVHCLESLYEGTGNKITSLSSSSTTTKIALHEINSLHSTYSSLFRPFLPVSPLELAKFLAERKRELNSLPTSSSTSSAALTSASIVGSDSLKTLNLNMKYLRRRNRERDLARTLNGRKSRLGMVSSPSTSSNSAISNYRLWHRWKIRNKMVGFLRRTSHLSLTSDFSSDASYYLIGKQFFYNKKLLSHFLN